MRLFLSSQDFGIYPEVLVDLVGSNKKVAFINNAKDDLSDYERREATKERQLDFERLGFDFTEIDLRKYFKEKRKLLNLLSDFGLVWCAGGNTFVLRRALTTSGLDKVLAKMVKDNKIAYGGSSAGAIIATPSLRGTEHGDDPNSVPGGYSKKIIWDGLNFVPFYIVPHYKSDWFGAEAEVMADYMQKHELPFYALMDGQVVTVDGDKTELMK